MGRLIFLGFSALLHAYIGLRLAPALAAWPWAQIAFAVFLACSTFLIPLSLISRRSQWGRLTEPLAWLGMLCMGLFSSLFVLALVRDAALLLAAALSWFWPALLPTPAWEAASGQAALALAALATLIGFVSARRTAAVVHVDIPIAGLAVELHGFTIAQITDIHVGHTIKAGYVHAVVEAVNRLGADMVAITGDLVDGSVAELRRHVAPLARLASRHGTFFVTGNHEYYSGAHAWITELQRLDIRVLMNEHVVVQHDDAALVVAGVTDVSAHLFDATHRSDPHSAIAGAPEHASMRLLLAHQPRSAAAAADAGFHLQISGHTHGGQFLPWNFFVRLQQPFVAGLRRLEDLWVYTSRGTGYWGPPNRFGIPSEITLLRLVPEG
jgi:hypothetical protein